MVSNFIKHADEKSEKELRLKRPDLFINSIYLNKNINTDLSLNEQCITFSLIGKEFYLTVEDIKQYSFKIITFWEEFWKEIIRVHNKV